MHPGAEHWVPCLEASLMTKSLKACVVVLLGFSILAAIPSGQTAGQEGSDDKAEKKLKAGDRDPAFLGRVNAAIEKGVAYLQSKQDADGHWKSYFDDFLNGPFTRGVTALCLFALLKSGVNRNDPNVAKGFDFLHGLWKTWCENGQPMPPQKESWRTYDVGTTLIALEALYRAPNRSQVGLRKDLTEAAPPVAKARVQKEDLEWMRQLAMFLQVNMGLTSRTISSDGTTTDEKTTWSYPLDNQSADRSNTQFAVLGLAAAARCGIPTDEKIWRSALANFIDFQQKRAEQKVPREVMVEDKEHGYVSYKPLSSVPDEARGWSYYTGQLVQDDGDEWHKPTGSMTCVGISVVLIAMDQLKAMGKLKPGEMTQGSKAAWDGIAWLNIHFSVEKNPNNENKWLYYYLYGLERACVLAGVRNIGKHDWYRQGAEYILSRQLGEGSWFGQGEGDIVSTCLALLFLTKATTPVFVKISGG